MTEKIIDNPILRITHDGFPLESHPPQGTITIYYEDGTTETAKTNINLFLIMTEKNGLVKSDSDPNEWVKNKK
jgi:hypothetical protein